jgi:hypothetical protein
MRNVIDFIVLRQVYESSIRQNWKIGDEFRSIIGNKYWFGTIVGFNENEYSKNSWFKRYRVEWFAGGSDWLSPWDLETVNQSLTFDRRSSLRITDEDRRMFFISDRNDWPKFNEYKELKRIASGNLFIH